MQSVLPAVAILTAVFIETGSAASAHALLASSSTSRRLQLAHSDRQDGALYSSEQLRGNGDHSSLTVQMAGGPAMNLGHSDALFGIPAYGGGRTGRLYYPASHDPSGCNAANLTSDAEIPPLSIFLLDRGDCPFTVKVAAAQAAGAIAVIVVDNLGLCGRSPECGRDACSRCPLYSTATCQCSLPYLGDDSSGAGISIPSMMIGREDGAELKQAAAVGKSGPPHILASMRWDLPAPDDKVSFTLWHSPNDPMTLQFRQAMAPYLPYFLPRTDFLPRPYIFDGRALGCSGASPVFDCRTQCTNNGYYCAIDPDGDLDAGISGADVVKESVRSLCVAQQAGGRPDGGQAWWDYSAAYQAECGTAQAWGEACSYKVMTRVGIDIGRAGECYAAANASVSPATGDYTNSLLQAEVNARADMGIVTLPTVMVNDILLRGSMSPAGVLSAICAGYATGTAPPVCGCLGVPVDTLPSCVATASGQGGGAQGPSGLPAWAGVLIAFCVIGVIIALGLSYAQSRAQAKLSGEMTDLMDDYRALVEGEDEVGPGGAAGAPAGQGTAEDEGAAGKGGAGHSRRVSRERLRASAAARSASREPTSAAAPPRAGSNGAGGWMADALARIMTPPPPAAATFATSATGQPQPAVTSVV